MTASIYLYAIRDVAIGHYAPPFLARSDAEAKAMVRDAMEPGSVLARFPRDYQLYRIGEMNEKDGLVDNKCECVCSVYDLARREVLEDPKNSPEEDPENSSEGGESRE